MICGRANTYGHPCMLPIGHIGPHATLLPGQKVETWSDGGQRATWSDQANASATAVTAQARSFPNWKTLDEADRDVSQVDLAALRADLAEPVDPAAVALALSAWLAAHPDVLAHLRPLLPPESR